MGRCRQILPALVWSARHPSSHLRPTTFIRGEAGRLHSLFAQSHHHTKTFHRLFSTTLNQRRLCRSGLARHACTDFLTPYHQSVVRLLREHTRSDVTPTFCQTFVSLTPDRDTPFTRLAWKVKSTRITSFPCARSCRYALPLTQHATMSTSRN